MAGHGAARRESDLELQVLGFGSWMERRSFGFGARFHPLCKGFVCSHKKTDPVVPKNKPAKHRVLLW